MSHLLWSRHAGRSSGARRGKPFHARRARQPAPARPPGRGVDLSSSRRHPAGPVTISADEGTQRAAALHLGPPAGWRWYWLMHEPGATGTSEDGWELAWPASSSHLVVDSVGGLVHRLTAVLQRQALLACLLVRPVLWDCSAIVITMSARWIFRRC